MLVREIFPEEKTAFNKVAVHPLGSWEWGEFREKTGVKVKRLGLFEKDQLKESYQITFHPLPKTSLTVGYFPKGPALHQKMLEALKDLGNKEKAIFIKLEPNSEKSANTKLQFPNLDLRPAHRPLFTKYTFQLDLKKSEEALSAQMKQKTRYNVNLSQKRGVKIEEDNSLEAFNTYLKLLQETTKRQQFYAHNLEYHKKMWQILYPANIAHLLKASFENEILACWILFIFNGVLYYPYGASSNKQRNLMASNLLMWKAIRFGKKQGCHTFDMWGSLGPEPDENDPWYGFHKFKEGYGGRLVEFIGSFDLVLNPKAYTWYCKLDSLRWKLLRFKKSFL